MVPVALVPTIRYRWIILFASFLETRLVIRELAIVMPSFPVPFLCSVKALLIILTANTLCAHPCSSISPLAVS